ncbi:MAG: pyruvate dehydrogenase E2 component (dihydrolipoamide acetyltransferase) [Pirellulaceae bacterium]|jgi:pyruvate dehydrogenase E2 component (dihydrolipoamide acetyltransferase)
MATEVKVPMLTDDFEEGVINDIFVSEGDEVTLDQDLMEVEAGKANAPVPSPVAGRIVKIHVQTGDTVTLGTAIMEIEAVAAKPAEPPKPAVPVPAEPPQVEAPPPAAPTPPPAAVDVSPVATPPQAAPAAAPVTSASTVAGGSVAASPSVRRFAREVGVDLRHVTGSGQGDRITREDVLRLVRENNKNGGAPAKAEPLDADDFGPVRYEPITGIRRVIAKQMLYSWNTVPRVTNFDDADVTALEHIRQSSKADYAGRGIKLTSMAFLIKSVALALQAHPAINAKLDEENGRVIYKEYVNIGIAVDSERGLVVPSLRNADKLSIPEIARNLATMAESVRGGKFTLDDLKGSTFTISNLGAIGGTYSTPIVNAPEVAILLVGRSRKMPIVVDDEVAIRLMMPLSLSYDHKLVDGGTAARFLNEIIGYLEAPSRLLLAP